MVKHRSNKSRKYGGFWPFDSNTNSTMSTSSTGYGTPSSSSIGNTLGSVGNSLGQYWNKAKQSVSGALGSNTGSSAYPSTSNYSTNTPAYSSPVTTTNYNAAPRLGGRRSRRRKHGGYKSNISLTNLASNAAPFSGQTARAHTLVGGKTRRRRRGKHTCTKNCRNRRHH
jgi:hypothetical protein